MPWLRSLIALSLCSTAALAGDWPQWLGPNRDGASPEKVAPWKGTLKVVWHKAVGEGNGAPVVAGGKVFIHAKVKDKNREEVVAFDAKNGKELWRKSYPRVHFKNRYGQGPRATAAVEGGRVYTFGITGVLTCYEAAKGKQLWQVDTLKKFGVKNLFFGVSCSPLVEGKHVIVAVGGKGAGVVAFDKENGEVAWKSLSDKASYSSPIVFGKGKERQLVYLTQLSVVSLNPADGKQFWRIPLRDVLLESSSTPARAGNILLAGSITFGSIGLKLTSKDDRPAVIRYWKNPALTSYFATPVAVGDKHFYMVTGASPLASPEATLRCIEAKNGRELWNRPKVGTYHASLLRTGNNKLLMLEEAGDLVLLDPSPKGYRELARSKVCDETWAHPALANGLLYVRDKKELICVQLGK